jgi:hypothetical protein
MFLRIFPRAPLALAAALGVLSSACTDQLPTVDAVPPPDGEAVRQEIGCTVAVATGEVRCDPLPGAGGVQNVILGGQGTYVRLVSSGLSYDSVAQVFSMDVTVQNLLGQQMGTPDGSTASGVRIFFERLPVATSGTGDVTVANPDGRGGFTRLEQPYFEYSQILEPRGASQPRSWRFNVPRTVVSFGFAVYVHAELPAEQGVLRWTQEEGIASIPPANVRAMWGASASDVFAVGLAGRILHFDGARWTAMPSGTAAGLLGVWGTSRWNVYAVGDSGTVLRYDGNRWNRLRGPTANRFLRTVWGRNDTLWIAGYQRDEFARTHGLIMRSTDRGASWTETVSTPESGNRQLWGITGGAGGALHVTGLQFGTSRGVNDAVILRSLDGGGTWTEQLVSETAHRHLYRAWAQGSHVVAVGEGYNPGATRWEGFTVRSSDGGNTWTREMHALSAASLYGVWGATPDDVTAVGVGGRILQFDGTGWTAVNPGATADFHAVWGSSAGNVFAAGNDHLLARRTERSWVLAPAPGSRALDYVAAWGPAPGDLYVVARSYNYVSNRWATALLRRTGGVWSTVRPGEENLELKSIWGSGPGNVIVAGFRYIDSHYEGVILRFDGTSWTETVSVSGSDRRFNSVHGDGAGNVWVAGHHQDASTYALDALVLRSANGGQNWTGTRIPVPQHTPQLFDVWASGPNDVHAVGRAFHNASGLSYGLRMRFDGAQWHKAVETVPSDLLTVWGTGDGTVYAGGLDGHYLSGAATGVILTSANSGATWTRSSFAPTVGNRRTVNAIWGASARTVYAAGSGGAILQLDGAGWESVGPFSTSLATLWGFSSEDVWALGGAGAVIHGTR